MKSSFSELLSNDIRGTQLHFCCLQWRWSMKNVLSPLSPSSSLKLAVTTFPLSKAPFHVVLRYINQSDTCIYTESFAPTCRQWWAAHKLEWIKESLRQRGLWDGFASRKDLEELSLKRINFHKFGTYYANDLSQITVLKCKALGSNLI